MNRTNTIKQMVRNYHAQVEIVGQTTLTLEDYLRGIGLNESELKGALEDDMNDNETITTTDEETCHGCNTVMSKCTGQFGLCRK